MDEKYIRALYDELSSGYELGTVAEFGEKLASDDVFRKALYDDASQRLDLGDYAAFEGQVKKKELTEFSLPSIENLQKDFQRRQQESGDFSVVPKAEEPKDDDARSTAWGRYKDSYRIQADLVRSLVSGVKKTTGAVAALPQLGSQTIDDFMLRPILRAMTDKDVPDDQIDIALDVMRRSTMQGAALEGASFLGGGIQDKLVKSANKTEAKMKEIEGTIWENVKEGDVISAFEQLGRGAMSTVPFLALTAASMGGGTAAVFGTIATTAASQQYGEIKGREDLSSQTRTWNSWAYGGAEAIGEILTAGILNRTARALRASGVKVTPEMGKSWVMGVLKKMGVIGKEATIEGASEVVTQLGQNAAAILSGENPDMDLTEGFGDAFWIGAVVGGGIATPQIMGRNIATKKELDAVKSSHEAQTTIIEQIEDATDPVVKDALETELVKLKDDEYAIIDKNIEIAQALTPEQMSEATKLQIASTELSAKVESGEMTNEEQSSVEETIKDIDKQIESIKKEGEAVLKEQEKAAETPTAETSTEEIKPVKFYDALKKNNAPRIQVQDEYGNERLVWDADRAEYMDISDETGRKIRWGVELSDGRNVSLDGLIRITQPDVWAKWEHRIKGMNLENKNEFIIKKTLGETEFGQLYEETIDFLEGQDVYSQTYRGRDEKTGEKKYTTDVNPAKVNKILKDEGHPLAGIFNRELTLKDGTKANAYQRWLWDLDQNRRSVNTPPTETAKTSEISDVTPEVTPSTTQGEIVEPTPSGEAVGVSTETEMDETVTKTVTKTATKLTERESILNQNTDLLGDEKEEAMIPVTYEDNPDFQVNDDVYIKSDHDRDARGNRNAYSVRGKDENGNYVLWGKGNGANLVVKTDDIEVGVGVKRIPKTGIVDAIDYAQGEGLYQQWIKEGRMTADDAIAIMESANVFVPQEVRDMATPAETPQPESKVSTKVAQTDTNVEKVLQVQAEPLKEEQEVKVEQRDRVRQEILSLDTKVTPEQADAAMAVFDAQAKVFAETLGKTEEDYYATIDVKGEAQASVQAREAQREGRTIKGQYQFLQGRDVVTLMKKGDVSTLLHEVAGHRGRRLLSELANANEDWKKRLVEVEKWAGVKKGQWTMPSEERFARAFEAYVRTGQLPKSAPQALREAFDKLVEWMRKIYRDPKVFDELPDAVKNTFDAMLGIDSPIVKAQKAEKTARVKAGDPTSLFQSVYHGSPHSFDKFTTEKIGTGEGVQAFGWGLYFTDKEGIAKSYAKGNATFVFDGEETRFLGAAFLSRHPELEDVINEVAAKYPNATIDTKDWVVRVSVIPGGIANLLHVYDRKELADVLKNEQDVFENLNKGIATGVLIEAEIALKWLDMGLSVKESRNLYKVKIHGDKAISDLNFMRWDKQVKPQHVDAFVNALRNAPELNGMARDALREVTNDRENKKYYNYTGQQLYQELASHLGTKNASLALLKVGIDGIQYPTETTTRGTHEDSFNYVVFDEGAVEIEEHVLFQEDGLETERNKYLGKVIAKVKAAKPNLTGKKLQDAIREEFLKPLTDEQKKAGVAEKWLEDARGFRALGAKRMRFRGVDVRSLREPSEAVEETDAMRVLRDRIDATREKYEQKAMQETIGEAMSVIEAYGNIETAFKVLTNTDKKATASITEDVAQAARQILISHYSERLANDNKDTDAFEAIDALLNIIRKRSTDYGRAGNIMRAWGMFQPIGLLRFIKGKQAKHNDIIASLPSKEKGKKVGELIDGMHKEVDKDIKDAVTVTLEKKEFEQILNKAKPRTRVASIQADRKALIEKYKKGMLLQVEGLTSTEAAMLTEFLDLYIMKGGVRKLSEAKRMLEDDLTELGVEIENFDEAFNIEFKNGESYRDYLGKLEAQKSVTKAIRDIVRDHFENVQTRRQGLAERLTWETGINDADAKAIEKSVTAEFDKKLKVAAEKYMTRMWGTDRVPQDRKARTVLDKLRTAIRAGAMTDDFFRQLFAAKFGFVDITEEQGRNIVALQGVIDEFKGTYWEADATRNLLRLMTSLYPEDAPNRFMETWTELIYASMLSGVSTSIINLGTVGSNYITKQVEDAVNISRAIASMKRGTWNAEVFANLFGIAETFHRRLGRSAKQYVDTMRRGNFGDKYTIEAVNASKVIAGNLETMKPTWTIFGKKVPNVVAWAKYSGRNLLGQDKLTTYMFEDHYLLQLLIDYQHQLTGKTGTALTKEVMGLYRNAMRDRELLAQQVEEEALAYTEKSGLPVSDTQKKIRLYELQRDYMFRDLLNEVNQQKALEAREEANDLARINVFTGDRGGIIASTAYAIGNGTAKLMQKSVGGKAAAMAVKVFIPFTRVVGNVAEYMLDYTPIYGFMRATDKSISSLAKAVKIKKTSAAMDTERQRAEQMGRAYFGTLTFLALGAMLLGSDEDDDVWIVGSMDGYKSERTVKPYSVNFRRKDGKITSISFMYLPALAIPLGLLGNLNDQIMMNGGEKIEDEKMRDILQRFSLGMIGTASLKTAFMIKDMSFVEGGAKLLEILGTVASEKSWETPGGRQYMSDEAIKRLLGFAARPLPQNTALVQQTWKFFDPVQYSSKGTGNAVKYALGLQRMISTPKVSDVLGHVRETYPGESQLFNYPNWFNLKDQDPVAAFLDQYDALPKMPTNRRTEIETEDGIEYRKLEPMEWEKYTLRTGTLFRGYVDEYMSNETAVKERYAEKKEDKDGTITTGVQEDVDKLWRKAKTNAGSELTEWGIVKGDTALWNKMVEHGAYYPYKQSKTIGGERLNSKELYHFNNLMAEEYAKLIRDYVMDADRVAYDKYHLTTSKKMSRWDYRLEQYQDRANDRATTRYKKEPPIADSAD